MTYIHLLLIILTTVVDCGSFELLKTGFVITLRFLKSRFDIRDSYSSCES